MTQESCMRLRRTWYAAVAVPHQKLGVSAAGVNAPGDDGRNGASPAFTAAPRAAPGASARPAGAA